MKKYLLTLLAAFALCYSCESADTSNNGQSDDSTEQGGGQEDNKDENVEQTIRTSDITAEVKTTAHVYKSPNNEDLHIYEYSLDEYNEGSAVPAIIFFHGGSWTSGTYEAFLQQSLYFATQGVKCFSVQYRLRNGEYGGVTADLPECLKDAKSAIRWVRANAETLNVNPDKIVMSGGSAGGHLAAAAAMCPTINESTDDTSISSAANLLVLFNPVVHTGDDDFQAYWHGVVKTACENQGYVYTDFSPFDSVTADVPPTLFMVGEVDQYIPPATAIEYQRKIEAVKGECELYIYQDKNHGFFGLENPTETKDGSGFVTTIAHAHAYLLEKGYLNNNACQVTEWMNHKGYTNYSTIDSFLYNTSITGIAEQYAEWCISGDVQYGANLVVNGEFEGGSLEGWDTAAGENAQLVSGVEVITGDNSLLVSEVAWSITRQEIAVEPGKTYAFGYTGRHLYEKGASGGQAAAEAVTTGGHRIFMQLRSGNWNNTGVKETGELIINSGTDSEKYDEITVPEGITSLFVVLNTSGYYGYFDDVFVKEILE